MWIWNTSSTENFVFLPRLLLFSSYTDCEGWSRFPYCIFYTYHLNSYTKALLRSRQAIEKFSFFFSNPAVRYYSPTGTHLVPYEFNIYTPVTYSFKISFILGLPSKVTSQSGLFPSDAQISQISHDSPNSYSLIWSLKSVWRKISNSLFFF
jgi:hypothetical protein